MAATVLLKGAVWLKASEQIHCVENPHHRKFDLAAGRHAQCDCDGSFVSDFVVNRETIKITIKLNGIVTMPGWLN